MSIVRKRASGWSTSISPPAPPAPSLRRGPDATRARLIEDRGSGENALDHPAVDVGEAEVAAAVAVRQALVVDPEQVQDRGVQVMDMDAVLYGLDPQFVG